jgi:hypothetical protein
MLKRGTNFKGSFGLACEEQAFCIRFHCYIFSVKHLLEITIYTSLSYWFSPWGFFQGHVDKKLHVFICHVCLVFSVVGC